MLISFPSAGVDYVDVSEPLVFVPGGPTIMCVDVVILEDGVEEDDEFFTCIITGPVPPPVTVTITISDGQSFILDC